MIFLCYGQDITLITDWKSKLAELSDYMDDDFVDTVELDKDLIIDMVEDLKASCRNYIYFRVPEDFKDIVQYVYG